MSAPVFFTDSVTGVKLGDLVHVTGSEAHHAATVRRIRVQEVVRVADGRGKAVEGHVVAVSKDDVSVCVEATLEESPQSLQWVCVQAIPKGERASDAVEMLTEAGANTIIAWQADRCVSRWDTKSDKGIAKWRATAREAAKQSRRFSIPEVEYSTSSQLMTRLHEFASVVVLHESATTWIEDVTLPTQGSVAIIIGPEGGITDAELAQFSAAGAHVVRIAANVLRTATAGVVALAQLQSAARRAAR
jgi:16S rRNA (uracil1498-N3)-methyltransferase